MSELLDEGMNDAPPVWAIFGDLMTGLVGVFVLILIWTLGFQLELAKNLEQAEAERALELSRRQELEQALAAPLASGRITISDGRIGIRGSVLFALNSAQLQEEGRDLLTSLAKPLSVYLQENDQLLMISGFTDDLAIQTGNRFFADNWELSAQRSLTVTRELVAAGLPAERVFAAAFGEQQPVASNLDESGRALNRRVEMAPIPRIASSEVQSTDG